MYRDRFFLVAPSNRTKGNRHKLEHRKFLMKVRKNFFDLKVIEHWNRLPERLWSLLLWRYLKSTCITSCNEPALAGGLD